MGPLFYDPNSPDEQPVPLPSAPLVTLGPNSVLQPPLSRRGTGPGLVIFLPQPDKVVISSRDAAKPLDPEPIQKWAEEGFAVVGITASEDLAIEELLKQGLDALQGLDKVDTKDKFAVIGEYRASHASITLRLKLTYTLFVSLRRRADPLCLRSCGQRSPCCGIHRPWIVYCASLYYSDPPSSHCERASPGSRAKCSHGAAFLPDYVDRLRAPPGG